MPIRDNKLARKTALAKRKKTSVEAQQSVDEQLTRLEDDIRRLKIEFDVFFNGATKRPPYDTKGRVDTVFKRLSDDRSLTYAERYRLSTLQARYASFQQLWRRTMQGREEGRDPATAHRPVHVQPERTEGAHTFTCADPGAETETVKSLYNALRQAKERCGESTEDFSFQKFQKLITTKTDSLKSRLNCDRVSFSVAVVDGRVSFKARGEKNEGDPE